MARFSVDIPDDFMSELLQLDDNLCSQILEEAVPILVKEIKVQIQKKGHVNTGELVESIAANKPYANNYGKWSIYAGPKGYSKTHMYYAKNSRGVRTTRKYKISNAVKLIWIEYGNPNQDPTPVLDTASKNSESSVISKMQEAYDRLAVKQ